MPETKLNWWEYVCSCFEAIRLMWKYGLKGALKEADKEAESLKKQIYILKNWRN